MRKGREDEVEESDDGQVLIISSLRSGTFFFCP